MTNPPLVAASGYLHRRAGNHILNVASNVLFRTMVTGTLSGMVSSMFLPDRHCNLCRPLSHRPGRRCRTQAPLVGVASQPQKGLTLELGLGDASVSEPTAQQIGRMAYWDLQLWDAARAGHGRHPGDRRQGTGGTQRQPMSVFFGWMTMKPRNDYER